MSAYSAHDGCEGHQPVFLQINAVLAKVMGTLGRIWVMQNATTAISRAPELRIILRFLK